MNNKIAREDLDSYEMSQQYKEIICRNCYDLVKTKYDGDPDWFTCKLCKEHRYDY